MLAAKIEHFLRLRNAADQRTGQRTALENQVADRRRRMRMLRHADERHRSVALEQRGELIEVVRGSNGVEDEIERVDVFRYFCTVFLSEISPDDIQK